MIITADGILKRLGKHIIIYPFSRKSVKGVGYNLSISKYAWSISRKIELVITAEDGESYFRIQPGETALVETEETVWISPRVAGTFHSKVDKVSEGFSPISTTLDPGWIGPLLIAVTNLTKEERKLKLGESFVTLIFHTAEKSRVTTSNPSGRMDRLSHLGLPVSDDASGWLNEEFRKNLPALQDRIKSENVYQGIESFWKKLQDGLVFILGWIPLFIITIAIFRYYGVHPKPTFFGTLLGSWVAATAIGFAWISRKKD